MTITVSTVLVVMGAAFLFFTLLIYCAAGRAIDAIENISSKSAAPTKGTRNDSAYPEVDLGADHHHSAR